MKKHIGHPKLTGVPFVLSACTSYYVHCIDFYVEYGYTLEKRDEKMAKVSTMLSIDTDIKAKMQTLLRKGNIT